jgi:tRNA wybutosine-synthesizing protein 1
VDALGRMGYRTVGNHSAVRVCRWTKNSLLGQGVCFKEKWYDGFQSHRCLQMTPAAVNCTQQCQFCWAPQPADVPGERWHSFPFPTTGVDNPEDILSGCLEERRSSMVSLKEENTSVDANKFEEALNPTHIGICLSGEPALYPRVSEIIEEACNLGMNTSHLVTNGTMPETLESMDPLPSRLFVSLYAPDKHTYVKTCRPLISDGWAKVNRTLELLPSLSCKTTVELTLAKGLNMINPAEYAKLIEIANPGTVDIKAFQHAGGSLLRMAGGAEPEWWKIRAFADEVSRETGYAVKDEIAPFALLLSKN